MFSFYPSILLRDLNTRFLVKDTFGGIKGREIEFRAAVSYNSFKGDMMLIFNKGNKVLNM